MANKFHVSKLIKFLLFLFGLCFKDFGFYTIFTEAVVCTQRKPLGLSTGRIPSANISSSTSFNANQNFEYAPSQARLNTASSWCGSDNGTWKIDWLQVDFGAQVNLTGIAVQGIRNKPADILAEFYLQMSDDGIEFRNQTDSNGNIEFHKVSVTPNVGQKQYYWFQGFSGKFLRIRASKLLISTAESRFCLSFEVYGCRPGSFENELYPIGLENYVIPDSQITASSMLSTNPPHHGRLNFPNCWCAASTVNQWLQIDLGRVLRVKGITTKGSYGRSSKDMVSLYLLSYANQSSSSFEFVQYGAVNKTFLGNTKTSEDPVMNVIDTTLIARYIRINPIAGYNGSFNAKQCMRVEIYVVHPDCNEALTASSGVQLKSIVNGLSKSIDSSIDIFSSISWCATVTNEFLRLDLGTMRLVTGIAISGISNSDNWITKFDVRYGFDSSQMKIFGAGFQGAGGRESIAVHWLKQAKVMQFVDIIPKEYFGNKCLRLRIIGCSAVPTHNYTPNITSVKPYTRSVVIKSKDSGNHQVNGTIIKYSCIPSNHFAPCSETTKKNISKWLTSWNKINLTGLRPWTKYSFSVQYVLSDSWTMETKIVQFVTLEAKPAAAPNGCRIISVNQTLFSLSWNTISPNSMNGILIGYQISLKKTNLIQNFTAIGSVSGTQYTVRNISPDTMYTVLVSATNKAGSGPPCRIDVTTLPEAPKALQNFTATTMSNTVIRLSWTKPSISGLRYYLLSYKEARTNERFEKLSPNFTYYYFNINNQTGVYQLKVSAHTTVSGLWSSILVYQTTRPDAITETETEAGLSFVRKSELALICSATTIVILAVVILLTQALVERNGMITREKRYVEYMKNIQCENLGNYIKNGTDKNVDKEILEDRTAMRQFIEKHTGKKHKLPKLSSPHRSISSSDSVAATEENPEPISNFHSSHDVSSSLPNLCSQNGNSSVLPNGGSKHDHLVTVAPVHSMVKSGIENPGFEHENDQRKLPPIKSRAPRKSGLENLGPARNGNGIAWNER